MKWSLRCRRSESGFTLLELMVVLSILSIITGLGSSATMAVRQWMQTQKSHALFLELITACRLYRIQEGHWPDWLAEGSFDCDNPDDAWKTDLQPFMEQPIVDVPLVDGFGNVRIRILVDHDGDGLLEGTQLEGIPAESRPAFIHGRLAVYSLRDDGRLSMGSWEYGAD